ncbi:MAG: SUMF1/EgtB/PvdO family nonheme iron enzyme [Planctomycetota bacterium]|nr:SUMF1/EgtB/PvdO family nonheme iron enzyme [Planctomycetota bacterium]
MVCPVEVAGQVRPEEAASFEQAVTESLAARSVRLGERKQLKAVFDEYDLKIVSGAAGAGQGPIKLVGLDATHVLVPIVIRIENDYLLSLRVVRVADGTITSCLTRRTRLVSHFPQHAKALAGLVAGAPPAAGTTAAAELSLAALREQCEGVKAASRFRSLWTRCEALRKDPVASSHPLLLTDYYVHLLRLCAAAADPPDGMVFVPGGTVRWAASGEARTLWVEPFFIDRRETTVAEFSAFLADLARRQDERATRFQPITRRQKAFNGPDLPVTGVPWPAADAYARWRGRQLPTWLQFLRSCQADDGRQWPCGARPGGNLAGDGDGHVCLAPADEPCGDVSAFGALGLTGNVREWTATWYRRDLYASNTPAGVIEPDEGVQKIVAGGGWRSREAAAGCGTNEAVRPAEAFDDVGFRCAAGFWTVFRQFGAGNDGESSSKDKGD